ncbi:thioredoxin-like protein [Morchella snyderi]|nr:thioredoxin-like protein [Morchella snyderi]
MFRFHKTLDVLTLFHAPKSAPSKRVLDLLKAASASAGEGEGAGKKAVFELEVVDAPAVPTPSQLRSILEFAGKNRVGEIVRGAASEREAMKALDEDGEGASERVLRPLLVDWNNGRTVIGADESAIKNLIDTLPK